MLLIFDNFNLHQFSRIETAILYRWMAAIRLILLLQLYTCINYGNLIWNDQNQTFPLAGVSWDGQLTGQFNISGKCVMYVLGMEDENYEQYIFYLERNYTYWKHVLPIMRSNAKAIIFETTLKDPGLFGLNGQYHQKKYGWDIPFFQLSTHNKGVNQIRDSFSMYPYLNMTITNTGNKNLWESDFFYYIIAIQSVVFGIWNLILLVLIVMRLRNRWKYPMNAAKIYLILELVNSFFRFAGFCIDPFTTRGLTTWTTAYFLIQFTVPLSITGISIIILYYNQSTIYVMKSYNMAYVKKCRIPIFICLLILGAMTYIAIPILFILVGTVFIISVNQFLFCVMSTVLGIYICHSALKVLEITKESTIKTEEVTRKSYLILFGGVLSILWAVGAIIWIPLTGYAYLNPIFFALWGLLLLAMSTSFILIIKVNRNDRVTATSANRKSKRSRAK
eukprot:TRINITY_DN2886_c0_g2_i1.p1 TRINITY_DN2886_c0_g2~~TRINITY_DN2886_c0_g2_i1.p1  ORF type:complete len:448 (+),score=44.16 TRINITY_DN2886_c0_g2_i1:75-1418(+)